MIFARDKRRRLNPIICAILFELRKYSFVGPLGPLVLDLYVCMGVSDANEKFLTNSSRGPSTTCGLVRLQLGKLI